MSDSRAGDVRAAYPLFQAEGGGSTPTSALGLLFHRIALESAISLNRAWHSRLPNVESSNVLRNRRYGCYAAEAGGNYYAVAIWSSPVARLLDPDWLELRRLAISDDAPKNTASRFLGWMVRDIRRRWPDVPRLISYQDTAVHAGTIYRAAGWRPAEGIRVRGRDWVTPDRQRVASQASTPKIRWERELIAGPPAAADNTPEVQP